MVTLIELLLAILLFGHAFLRLSGPPRRRRPMADETASSVPAPVGIGAYRAAGRPRVKAGLTAATPPLLLFVLAVILRWWDLGAQSGALLGDEAQLMAEARKFGEGIYTGPFLIDHLGLPALYDYLISIPMRLTGNVDVTVARETTSLVAALGAPLVYVIARELGLSRLVGIMAGVAYSTSEWSLLFSRMVLQNIVTAPATAATVLLLVMAVRRGSLSLAALAGVGLAWAFNTYLCGTMVVPIVFGWLGLALLCASDWRVQLRRLVGKYHANRPGDTRGDAPGAEGATREGCHDLSDVQVQLSSLKLLGVTAVFSAVSAVCLWPLLQLYTAPDSGLVSHATERLILTASNRASFASAHPEIGSSLAGLLWYQLKATLGVFSVQGEIATEFNIPGRPLLDPLSAALLYIGFAGCILRIRRSSMQLLLLWFVVPLVLGMMLTTGFVGVTQVPTITRSLPALPALCLLIGLGLQDVLLLAGAVTRRVAGRWARRQRHYVPALLVAVAVAGATGVMEVQQYWDYADSPTYGVNRFVSAREWGSFIQPLGAVPVTVISPQGWSIEFSVLYAPHARICVGLAYGQWNTACPPSTVILFDRDQADAAQYAALTHLAVLPGPSDDSEIRFWYVKGARLPDPVQVLHAPSPFVAGTPMPTTPAVALSGSTG